MPPYGVTRPQSVNDVVKHYQQIIKDVATLNYRNPIEPTWKIEIPVSIYRKLKCHWDRHLGDIRNLPFLIRIPHLGSSSGKHYIDVIMTTMASQITSPTIVYSTDYSDVGQWKHQSSASLAFVWGIHRDRWIPRTKGQLHGKCFHLMTSSWKREMGWRAMSPGFHKFGHATSLSTG